MKKLSILTAFVAMLFLTGCQPGFPEKNLYGTWENADKPGDYKVYENSFVVPLYLHEGDSVFATYKWGHEWDENYKVYEKDRFFPMDILREQDSRVSSQSAVCHSTSLPECAT